MPDDRDMHQRFSACYTDFSMKIGSGLLIGGMIRLFFLKGRSWPLILGASAGFGMAYVNCENNLNRFLEGEPDKDFCKTTLKEVDKKIGVLH